MVPSGKPNSVGSRDPSRSKHGSKRTAAPCSSKRTRTDLAGERAITAATGCVFEYLEDEGKAKVRQRRYMQIENMKMENMKMQEELVRVESNEDKTALVSVQYPTE